MKCTKIMAGIWILHSWQNSFSQTLQPSVFASAGTSWIGATTQCNFTIGETITSSIGSGTTQLTQGFHQTFPATTGVETIQTGSLRIYPNPAQDYVVVENLTNNENCQLELTDAHGQVIMVYPKTLSTQTIPISHLAPAVYFITLRYSHRNETYKIIKKSNQ